MNNKPTYKNFCVLPFVHLATTTEGNCRLCCKVSKFDTINKPDGTPYNVNVDSVDEIWNSAHYNEIRNIILRDEKLLECATCWREEELFRSDWSKNRKNELPSKRRIENQKWLHREKTKLADSFQTVIDDPKIRYFDVRLSNLCNLKCRMCWPHFSSQIVKEQREFDKAGLPTHYVKYVLPEWDTKLLFQGIEDNLIALEETTFVGGEPTLHEEMYALLDRLVSTGRSKSIRLKYTTNLTNIQDRLYHYAKNFKNTVINGSIDGVGPTNDYIRHPSDWTTIERNIDTILASRRDVYQHLTLTPVIQIYNVWNLGDIVRLYMEKWLNLEGGITKEGFTLRMDLLYEPSYLSVKRLNARGKQHWYQHTLMPTLEYIDNIIQNIDSYDRESRDYWYLFVELRKKLINIAIYMGVLEYDEDGRLQQNGWTYKLQQTTDNTDSSHDEKLAKKLVDYTKQLDKHRGQDVTDIIPGFYEYIE